VLCALARVAFVWLGGTVFAVGMLPFGSTDHLALGALLAELQSRERAAAPIRRWLGTLGIAIGIPLQILTLGLGPALVPDWWAHGFPWLDLTVLHVGVGLACFWLVDRASTGFAGPVGRVLSLAPLRWVGKVSYGIYVWHMFVIVGLAFALAPLASAQRAWLPTSDWTWLPWRTVATLGVAALSWHWFEEPINALKRHFPYRYSRFTRSPSVVGAETTRKVASTSAAFHTRCGASGGTSSASPAASANV
jgi:peptidoglycan/LPS O-acetylase OafA/YrhL